MDTSKQRGVRVRLGERQPNLPDGDSHQRADLEELEADRVALGLGELGSAKAEAPPEGAAVTLLDGRTFELDRSNDVNWDNKGILIAPEGPNNGGGSGGSRWRLVPWDQFKEARFRHDTRAQSGR